MGIKGRKRKLREREAKARAEAENAEGCGSTSGVTYSDDEDDNMVAIMGDGPFRPPVDAMGRLKMKKSEFFKMQDQDYLDRVKEEHSSRKQSHLRHGTGGGGGGGNSGRMEGGGSSLKRRRASGRFDAADVAADEAMAEAELVAQQYLVDCSESNSDLGESDDVCGVAGERGRSHVAASIKAKRGRTEAAAAVDGDHGGHWEKTSKKKEKAFTSSHAASIHLLSPQDYVDEQSRMLEHRRNAGCGARFSHPLISLDPVVVSALETEGFLRMTKIQERTIPYAIEGYDLLGQARTGSGKTLAFCVPVLHVCKDAIKRFPRATIALMLAPTKELCVQTHDVLTSVCQHVPSTVATITVQLITGGTKVVEERKKLTAGPSIVVGTPGRIHDHVAHCKGWDLTRLKFLVLDEADRMLADGFQRDLDAIISKLPKSRQTFLFSATNSKSVHELARLSLIHTPLFVDTFTDAPHPISLEETGDGAPSRLSHQRGGSNSAVPSNGLGSFADAGLPMPYRNFADVDDSEEEDEEEEMEGGHASDDELSDGNGDSEVDPLSEDGADENEAGEDGLDEAIPATLRQFCHMVPLEDRLRSLYVFVKQVARTSKAMIFCSTVASTTFHFQMMGSVGFHDDVMMLHGHMKHRQRVQAFQLFRQWQTGVLFCTDVAARGLDVPNVEWILQYDPPLDPTEYIHRIGRTARAGNVGNALLFLAPEEVNFIKYLSKFGITLARYKGIPEKLPRIHEKLEHVLQLDDVVAKSAVTAFRAHVGAYQSHILKETFNVHRLDLDRLAVSFALTTTPHVSLPKNAVEERKKEYVKGKLKSLNRRKMEALKHYERFKVKPQWEDGSFVGVMKPSL